MNKKIIIAIDGHSSCGKSTMAKELARQIAYTYIDSGAMYRAVAWFCLQNGLFTGDTLDEESLKNEIQNIRISFVPHPDSGQSETFLNGENVEKAIRSMEVADKVSWVAAVGFVREAMVKQQQDLGLEKGIVMDGRDIGTVVFPQAELKIFVTASPEIRAQRRWKELMDKGEQTTFEAVLNNLAMRDFIDSTRKDGPLRKADDALVLDNSNLTIEEQNQKLLEMYWERVERMG